MFEAHIENTVAKMNERAERVLAEALSSFNISHVLAAFSGGDDSIVSTHWAMNRFSDAVVMIADTQIGLQKTREHQERVIKKFNWDCNRKSPDVEGPPKNWDREWIDGNTSYEEFVLNHGFPGPCQHSRMYQRLKQRAFRKVKKDIGKRQKGSRILVVSGIRRDESSIRAGYKRAFAEESSECFVWMNPFYYCTATDFECYRQEFGLPRNPVKRECGISGECCCGAFASPGEREAYKHIEPAFDEYLAQLESVVNERFPWGWNSGPPKWWIEQRRGQKMMFEMEPENLFMPACVGCQRRTQ